MTPLEKLLDMQGSGSRAQQISQAAIMLGKSRQVVEIWAGKGVIPFRNGDLIEEKTGGAIKAMEVWEAAARSNS